MAQKILELKGYDTKQTENTEFDIVAQKIGTRKKQIFFRDETDSRIIQRR